MKTRRDFAEAFLNILGAPATVRNLRAMLAWMQAEGNAGKFNPLNTTLGVDRNGSPLPGISDFNSVGVKNYRDFDQGVAATVRTMNYGADRNLFGYLPIRKRLRGNSPAWKTLVAVERSGWGTGGLARKCLALVQTAASLKKYGDKPIAQ